MKKVIGLGLSVVLAMSLMAGCNQETYGGADNSGGGEQQTTSGTITIVSREDGSGTRGAFIELFGIEEKDSSGQKVDHTADSAEITNSTSVMMTTVAGNKNAIGYVSLGSLKNTVKALKIDGVQATAENIKNGTYKISRPFNIAIKEDASDLAKDFIAYIMSADGQKIVEEGGYISEGNTGAYHGAGGAGKIVVAGSSSVTPIMEKLKEAYLKVNTSAQIDVQQSDSTTGMTSTIDGICDIGMASRELKDSEKEKGLQATAIAQDGIAVIVNQSNTFDNLTSQQVKDIFTGNVTNWSDVK